MHDTPVITLPITPAGGVRWIDHLVPFQRSTSGNPVHGPEPPEQPAPTSKPPTTVQAVADVHDTPLKELEVAPAGLGIPWLDQILPFQRSTNGKPLLKDPAAMQAFADAHDTPFNPPAGLGIRCSDQVLPFQRSTNGPKLPTAVQTVADVHDTPLSPLLVAPAGWGIRWLDQVKPFQRSTNGTELPAATSVNAPTAVQALADVQDTPLRESFSAVLGARWIDQLRPFQRSTSAELPLQQSAADQDDDPTAMHALADVHDTPPREVSIVSPRLGVGGVGWTDQLLPFQRSANVTSWPALLRKDPTAVQALPDTHDTAESCPVGKPGTETG
ncbi:MAG: hypothetical protein ACJ780_02850 [Solirubrobacteraceae bacterium]